MSDKNPPNQEKVLMDQLRNTLSLMQEIKEQRKGGDWRGERPCPICGGVLKMTCVGDLDRILGQCATGGRIDCME
jgi:hypothetical protein